MPILLVGLNHRSAPIQIREQVAVSESNLPSALTALSQSCPNAEVLLLSTCNRSEVYIAAADLLRQREGILRFYSDFFRQDLDVLNGYFYQYEEEEAVHHIFRVAAGLDSMVVGEAQILGQVRDAFQGALAHRRLGTILDRLFRSAVAGGKRVRTETSVGDNAPSVSSAAVDLARKIFGHLENRTILVIGAGKMSHLTAKHLIATGIGKVIVTNRSVEKAEELARKYQGEAVEFERFPETLRKTDIVITSTSAPLPILAKDQIKQVMRERKNSPLFLIDLALPRDVDPAVHSLENVFLYNIDDLQAVVDESNEEREQEIHKATAIIDKEVECFLRWLHSLEAVPIIKALRLKAERIREEELRKALARLGNIGEKEKKVVEALSAGLVNKILHHSLVQLRERASRPDGKECMECVQRLFGMDISEIESQAQATEESVCKSDGTERTESEGV
ncbi:MAG: glutamyl-tRNA reductase [Armatimonadetes bacterium]|nr:glutamyl-tRNA reductase [Armatimonadota bacterium]